MAGGCPAAAWVESHCTATDNLLKACPLAPAHRLPACLQSSERGREQDSSARRERGSDRERRHRSRSRSRSPRRAAGHAPRSPQREAEPLRLTRELATLMNQLPPPHKREWDREARKALS